MAKNTIRIDFSKEEESGGGRVHWPDGDYHVKIVKAKATRSPDKDTPGLEVTFQVLEGKRKGKKVTDTLWLSPKALSRVRLLLEAVGVKVPKSAVNLPLGKLKGKTLWIELVTEKRDGYDPRSRVAFQGFMSEDEYEADTESDEDEDEDEDELDEDDDELEDEDEDDEDEDEDDEEPQPKKKSKSEKSSKKKSKKAKKADDDDEDDDIEELDLDEL